MSVLDSVADLPTWHPPHEVLELAELVLTGVIEVFPVPVHLPAELVGAAAVVLEDAEGTPVALARFDRTGPELEPLRPFSHGPLRSARLAPAQVTLAPDRGATPAGPAWGGRGGVLAVPVSSVLTAAAVEAVLAQAAAADQVVLWIAVFGTGRASALSPVALWRAVRSLAGQSADGRPQMFAVPVAVPVPPGGAGSEPDLALLESVACGYGATTVSTLAHPDQVAQAAPAGPARSLTTAALHPAFVREVERSVPAPDRRGVVIFFTGLSGSGKSTVAKALADELTEDGHRTVSLLDGDEVRRMLSAGLGFSRADRDLNIRRIGFVATEVARHGGIAICAPIAPFAQTRAQVRADVEAVGDFLLIHVSTPLAECERRDRKGLYAKARLGEIAEFTGISSPYEAPVDADLRLDTSGLDVPAAVAAVRELLANRGYLSIPDDSEPSRMTHLL